MLSSYHTQMMGDMEKPYMTQTYIHSLYVVYFKYAQYVKENRGNINITRRNESRQRNCRTQNLK